MTQPCVAPNHAEPNRCAYAGPDGLDACAESCAFSKASKSDEAPRTPTNGHIAAIDTDQETGIEAPKTPDFVNIGTTVRLDFDDEGSWSNVTLMYRDVLKVDGGAAIVAAYIAEHCPDVVPAGSPRHLEWQAEQTRLDLIEAERRAERLVAAEAWLAEHGPIPPDVIAYLQELESDPEGCTGITASWCPVHGDCSCSEPDLALDRYPSKDLDDPGCPLHSSTSNHPGGP